VRISQPPGRDFLYDSRTSHVDPRRPQGNPNLLAATAISYEAAYRHRINAQWHTRAGLFYRDLFRQVSARSVPAGRPGVFVLRYESDDAGRAQGFELAVACDAPGRGTVALYLNPLRPEDVFRVTAAGATLPQKSTFFHPKVPTGLVIDPIGDLPT